MSSLGDLDGDGVTDFIVTEPFWNTNEGVFNILFMNADGTVKRQVQYVADNIPNSTFGTNAYVGYDVDLI